MTITSLLLVVASAVFGQIGVFETQSYRIQIEVRCREDGIMCNNVSYVGTNKKTGKSIRLRGRTVHSYASDGVTPTQFQGYSFTNGSTEYFVSEHGYLEVRRGDKILFYEEGKWDWVENEK